MMLTFLLFACHNDTPALQNSNNTPGLYEKPAPFDPLGLEEGLPESVDIIPIQRRDYRRMNIFQLDKALLDLTGYSYQSLWKARGPLGQPDYQEIINEVREPELFFQKFLQDAAHTNCELLLNAEALSAPNDRKFLKYVDVEDTTETAVKDNLAFLLLRYHGHRYSIEDDAIGEWYDLFNNIQQSTTDTQTTWKAICVTLIRHPDFYAY